MTDCYVVNKLKEYMEERRFAKRQNPIILKDINNLLKDLSYESTDKVASDKIEKCKKISKNYNDYTRSRMISAQLDSIFSIIDN